MRRICLMLALAPCLAWADGQSLVLAGAYSQGLGNWVHGEAVQSSTAASGQGLAGSTSGPLAFEAQWLKPLGSHDFWETGAALGWRAWFQDEASSKTDVLTRSEAIELRAHFITLSALLRARWPMGGPYTVVAGAGLGLGYALLSFDERLTQTLGGGLETKKHHLNASALGPALTLSLGAERQLDQRKSFGLSLELGAFVAALSGDSRIEYRDPSGNLTRPAQSGQGPLDVDRQLNSFYISLQANLRFGI